MEETQETTTIQEPERIEYGVSDRIAAHSLLEKQALVDRKMNAVNQEQKVLDAVKNDWINEIFEKAGIPKDSVTAYLITPDGLIRQS